MDSIECVPTISELPGYRGRQGRGRRRHRRRLVRVLSCGNPGWTTSSSSRRDTSARARAAAALAGVVRMQGGTPEAVKLGRWSRDFYLAQHAEIGTDSGFTRQGYLLPCFTAARGGGRARRRIAMQQAEGIPVRWAAPGRGHRALNPTMAAPGETLGASYCAEGSAYIDAAAQRLCLYRRAARQRRARGREKTGEVQRASTATVLKGTVVATSRRGPISAGLVILTGGPKLAAVGALAGIRIPAAWRAAPGRRDRGTPRRSRTLRWCSTLPSGLYWAAGGGRAAVRHEQPGRAAGRGPQRGRALPGADAPAAVRQARAAHRRPPGCAACGRATPSTSHKTTLPIIGPALDRDRVFVAWPHTARA